MRARILDAQVKLYSSPEPNALSLATLAEGAEIEFGGTIKKNGKQWIEVIMPTGQKGYIPREARLYLFRLAAPLANNVPVYNQPTQHSLVRATLKRNTRIYVTGTTRGDDREWVKVRDLNGVEGYIAGNTRLRLIPEKTRALARKNMLSGAMWCLGGAIILSTLQAGSGDATYLMAWAAILFGAFQLIQGVYQFVTIKS